jgi:hypothetical protein
MSLEAHLTTHKYSSSGHAEQAIVEVMRRKKNNNEVQKPAVTKIPLKRLDEKELKDVTGGFIAVHILCSEGVGDG